MGFLAWIKNRNAVRQQSVSEKPQRPESAKEMYARQAALEETKRSSLGRMPPDQQAKVDAIKAKLEQATRHIGPEGENPSPGAADGSASPEPMRQKMTGQDKMAPALSPTSNHAGQPATEKNARSGEQPAKTQERAKRAPQTLPRRPPSWER